MLKLGAERDELKIIADQVGTPTYAIDLAAAILDIITSGSESFGIYHYSNEGVITWYDFAVAIKELIKSTCQVIPIPSVEYPTPAKRPGYSVFDTGKIKMVYNIKIPRWEESLDKCIRQLPE